MNTKKRPRNTLYARRRRAAGLGPYRTRWDAVDLAVANAFYPILRELMHAPLKAVAC